MDILQTWERVPPNPVRGFFDAVRKGVCSLMAALMIVTPTWSYGTETNLSAIGKEAHGFGEGLGSDALSNFSTSDGTTIKFQANGETGSINSNDLSAEAADLNRKWTKEDIEALKGLFDGDDDEGTDRGESAREELFGDDQTIEGQIHNLLIDEANRVDMDKNDQILKVAESILSSVGDITDGFADCSSDTIFKDIMNTVHVPKLVQCEQVLDRSGPCTIVHDYQAGVIRYLDGPYNIESCGEGCTQIWLGKVGNNYIPGGSCSLHEEEILFTVLNPDAITVAELDYAAYDDQMQVWIGPRGRETKVYQGPKDTFPYEEHSSNRVPGVACELNTHWIWDPKGDGYKCTESSCAYIQKNLPAIDITSYLKSAGEKGDVRFYLRDAIGGHGEAFARMRIYYDASKAIVDDAWNPSTCLEAAIGVSDGFAKGTVKCIDMPKIDSATGCAVIDGVFVCEHHLNPSPLSKLGISNLCRKVGVKAQFDYYKGEVDWVGPDGETSTEVGSGGALDKCEKYVEQGCAFMRSECTEGAKGESGTCYIADVTYDCGEDMPVKDTEVSTEYDCPGEASCMGEECINLVRDPDSESFAQVSALLNSLQYMGQDMECTGTDSSGGVTGQENVTCKVFSGNASKCKIVVGGVQDCCEPASPVGMAPYLNMLSAKSDGQMILNFSNKAYDWLNTNFSPEMAEVANEIGHGAWSFYEGASFGFQGAGYIAKYSEYLENINSWKDLFLPSTDVLMKHAVTAIKQYIQDQLMELFKEAGEKLFGEMFGSGGAGGGMANGAAGEVMGAMGAALGVVAMIYAAYCAAVMLIQAIYKCTEEELQFTAMLDVGNCHYIGSYCDSKVLGICIKKIRSYCCFNSPLSRILQEQIRKQGDVIGVDFGSFGSAKHPSCAGVPLDKVGLIDWDKVDLSEWIAILQNNGQFPNADNINVETMTGKDSDLNYDGNRVNTIERNTARMKAMQSQFGDTPVDQRRDDAAEAFTIDSGYRPDKNP